MNRFKWWRGGRLWRVRRLVLGVLLFGALGVSWVIGGEWDGEWRGGSSESEGIDTLRVQTQPAPTQPTPPNTPPEGAAPANRAAALSQRIVEYHIGVTLDPTHRTLHGTQTVLWRNPGRHTVRELIFHLYPNAFASADSTFARESGGQLREDRRTEHSVGSMEVTSLETTDGFDLMHRMQFIQPNDGNKADRTLFSVRLGKPVAPGETVTLQMEYRVKLPEVYARMGYKGDFVMAGQWFPKVAVYEPAGRRGRTAEGWNAHQYHGNSEFYADFGIYNVKIQVPAEYTVAATGFPPVPAVPDRAQGTKTYHFYAEDVHDFAWAASPDFIYAEEPYSAPNVPGVKIKLYLDPSHLHLKQRYLYAIKKSLEHYSLWYGEYPYNTLSVVVPPAGAGGAGGMEYPTLITAWAADSPQPGAELERVLVHEIGHQYWYGLVANNEFEEAWLDEGFTSYAEDKVMEAEFGMLSNTTLEALYMTAPAPLRQVAWAYRDHDHYAENVYIRGKLVLLAIEQIVGEKEMRRVLRHYADRWKFRHPSTDDFRKSLEEVTVRDWGTFFRDFVDGDRMVDYAVEHIHPVLGAASGGKGSSSYAYQVVLRSLGGYGGAVNVHFAYEDGTIKQERWDARTDRAVLKLPPQASPLLYVEVDPEQEIVLEHRRINNFRYASVDAAVQSRWHASMARLLEVGISLLAW
jgi:hypothetical protein